MGHKKKFGVLFRKSILWIVVIVVLCCLLVYLFFNFEKTDALPPANQIPGVGDVVTVGNLSFRLTQVALQKVNSTRWDWKDTSEGDYTLFWVFEVNNFGDKIENVSNCGILLFEDGSQYKFDVSREWLDRTGYCNYIEMVPGSIESVYSTFHFSDNGYWKGKSIAWSQVSGSKIVYFSQQNDGLVKFVIDKNQIT